MPSMTDERWQRTNTYLDEVFGREAAELERLRRDAAAANLPDIAVNAVVGRLLTILTSMTRGRLAIEIGTLGGYSAAWIARGLAPAGRLITIEKEARHANFAEEQFRRLGLDQRIELRRGDALDVLASLAREFAPGEVDLVFLDADKEQYPEYWRLVRPFIAEGGLIVIDNALGSGQWWIDIAGHPARDAADRANRMIAGDPDFEAAAFPLRQGVLVARRMR